MAINCAKHELHAVHGCGQHACMRNPCGCRALYGGQTWYCATPSRCDTQMACPHSHRGDHMVEMLPPMGLWWTAPTSRCAVTSVVQSLFSHRHLRPTVEKIAPQWLWWRHLHRTFARTARVRPSYSVIWLLSCCFSLFFLRSCMCITCTSLPHGSKSGDAHQLLKGMHSWDTHRSPEQAVKPKLLQHALIKLCRVRCTNA